ncbi:hypothetical protein ACQKOE_11495 [Novosphingobium sp. NPDC080210]|uniref:hypothetical protein n=1 Tax=Novosphingobium sp. NPDC080210 TaxID=3390596 RepID=UPI003D07F723
MRVLSITLEENVAGRTAEDKRQEVSGLNQTHIQNEAARDNFIGLAHTALFAASVAFVGDVVPLKEAVFKSALLLSWLSSLVGLVALTFSFDSARRDTDARRQAIHEDNAPESVLTNRLNAIALWTFPIALIMLFFFLLANVENSMSGDEKRNNAQQLSKGITPPNRVPVITDQQYGITPPPRAPQVPASPPPTEKK